MKINHHGQSDIKEHTRNEIISWLTQNDIAAYRADQILKWTYQKQCDSFENMTNLSKDIRKLLTNCFTINRLGIETIKTSSDGTRKFLFELSDQNLIESVLIPEKDHFTLCVSTQVGCAQGCEFCNTASGGFIRNLTRGEIIGQVRDLALRVENDPEESRPLSNLVFMGMGEPLANYKNLVSALETIMDNDFGLRFSKRRVTVSTAGLVPRLSDLGRDCPVNLAISLNATTDEVRNLLMPINRKYPIDVLLKACRDYPLKPHRRITFEYVMVKGINDTLRDAHRLASLLKPLRAKINLIPFNPFQGCRYECPEEETVLKFQKILLDQNYTVIIRHSKGGDISAACGQLRAGHV